MPTENEIKFVLRLENLCEKEIEESSLDFYVIEQGYIESKGGIMVRVRSKYNPRSQKLNYYLQSKLRTKSSINYPTFQKSGVLDFSLPERVVEITADISERDFLDFWRIAKGKLKKIRYCLYSNTCNHKKNEEGQDWQEIWEVDFFKRPDGTNYLCLAEVELPEGAKDPLFAVPKIIANNTVFRVPLWDSRFSNSRLGDIEQARRLYESLSH